MQKNPSVFFRQRPCVPEEKQILVVQPIRGVGPIIGTRQYRAAVEHGEFLVHQTRLSIRQRGSHRGDAAHGNLLRFEKFSFRPLTAGVKFPIDDDLDRQSAFPGLNDGGGQLIAGKGLNGDEDLFFGLLNLTDDQ